MKNSSFRFDRFDFRRNLNLSRKLPLSFVKPIAEQHGGDVIVESELGKGSFFTMNLLLIKQHALNIPSSKINLLETIIQKRSNNYVSQK